MLSSMTHTLCVDYDDINIFFSIEYLVQDVEPILNASLNDVVRKTVEEKSNCLVESPDICMVDYDLSIRLLYFRKFLLIQFNLCAFVSYITHHIL